jgi:hypothetical protein
MCSSGVNLAVVIIVGCILELPDQKAQVFLGPV